MKFLILFLCFSAVLAKVEIAKKCPDGWKWFERSRGGWCMKIFKGTAITLPNAEAKCKAEGAVVAGLQNKDEAQWMGSTVPTVIGEHGYVWLGLKRTSLCKGKVLYSKCGPLNSFAWSDGSTVGISGYRWAPGEPNNMLGNQDCGVLHSKSEYMDDMACGADVVDSYVCGKVASF